MTTDELFTALRVNALVCWFHVVVARGRVYLTADVVGRKRPLEVDGADLHDVLQRSLTALTSR